MSSAVHAPLTRMEPLEPRTLLSSTTTPPNWGPVATLIHQDQAASLFPNINGAGEVIVDIDSGIDFAHPSLAGRIWSNPGETPNDGIDNDGNGFVDDLQGWNFYDGNNDPTDQLGHGTQTAGIMAADPWHYSVDGHDYQGIAPAAQILPLMVSTPPQPSVAFDQHVGQALDYVVWMVQNHPEYHIVAVNLSLAAFSQADYQQYMQADLQTLHDDGVFIAAASGNGSDYTAVDYPAADPNAYAIAGVNLDGTPDAVSNRSAKVTLLAPANTVPVLNRGSTYLTSGDGTSYATPFVTATAALIKQVNPAFTPDQIASILQRSGSDVYDRASHRTYRLLNVAAAIALAQTLTGPQSTPLFGAAATVPGVIQAEGYDVGGEGVAYHDTDSVNEGHRYRTGDGIDLERCYEGTYDVTNNYAGEYLKYTINVTAGGTYDINFRVAARRQGGTFHLEMDGLDVTGPITVPRTGATQAYTTITKSGVTFTAGTHVLKLVFDANSASGSVGNFDYIQIAAPARHRATAAAITSSPAFARPAASLFTTDTPTAQSSWLDSAPLPL